MKFQLRTALLIIAMATTLSTATGASPFAVNAHDAPDQIIQGEPGHVDYESTINSSQESRNGLFQIIKEFLNSIIGSFSGMAVHKADEEDSAIEQDVEKAKSVMVVSHSPPGGKGVSVGSADFDKWFENAAKNCSKWKFPDLTNKYGEKITPENYLRAIIWIESGGTHANRNGATTKSWAGALGFMQLMPRTARGLKVDPHDPAQNLYGGAKYLTEIFNSGHVSRKSGEEKLIMAACAYNLGPFSNSMKLTWDQLKASTRIPKETRGYGLKIKMSLGLELTQDEQRLAKAWLVPKGRTLESITDEFYANAMGIAQKKRMKK